MGWLKDAFDIARDVCTTMARPARAIRKIPVVEDAIGGLTRRYLNPIIVRRITDPRSPDLLAAFDLYEDRIPESQRFEAADLARWLLEDRENRGDASAPRDCFLVAKYKGRVCGFSLFHYYPRRHLVFFAYLVVAQKPGIPSGISDRLSERIALILRRNVPSEIAKALSWRWKTSAFRLIAQSGHAALPGYGAFVELQRLMASPCVLLRFHTRSLRFRMPATVRRNPCS